MPRLARLAFFILVLAIVASVPQRSSTQENQKTQYPAPRFPSYVKQPKSVDDLMPKAREFVLVTGSLGPTAVGMGTFKSGDTLLLVPDVTAEDIPLEAVRRALEERSIKVVIRTEAEMVGLSREDAEFFRKLTAIPSAEQGYLEARLYWFEDSPRVWTNPDVAKAWLAKKNPDLFNALYPKEQQIPSDFKAKAEKLTPTGIGTAIRKYLQQHREITGVYWGKPGFGFSGPRAMSPEQGKLKGGTAFTNSWVLSGEVTTFPSDVTHLIEKKTVEAITTDIDMVRVTDPEGTDLSWKVTPEMAKRWITNIYEPNHLLMYPDTATGKYGFNVDTFPAVNKEYVPREPIALANGVIAGTSGSGGFWPRVEITFKDGYMTKVEGGGLYGDVIRTFMTYPHINDLKYPYYDHPGYWHLWEIALGTNPKNFRNPSDFYGSGYSGYYCLTFERYRSGVIHWGLGNELPHEPGSTGPPLKWLKFGADNNLPSGHDFHIHNNFITYQVHHSTTGKWVKLVDRGHLVALDDPDVRALASKYGDPSTILGEDWVPEIPGINASGSYEDYSRDPWKYANSQMKKILDGTYEYYYPAKKREN